MELSYLWDMENHTFDISSGPIIIAGPCSAESEEQVFATASALKQAGIGLFRAGIWKPRTRPGCFEGVGEPGLPWLGRVRSELGMMVGTEVAGARHVEACLAQGLDFLWIGARTTTNPFLVQEIADALKGTDIPVLVKNPINPDLALWTGAIERLYGAGISSIGLIHRGFSSAEERKYRYAPQWQMAIEMRSRFPGMPFLCDPSHMSGKREYIPALAQRAMNLGLDGLMIESHCCPSQALSDAPQQLTPSELEFVLGSLRIRQSDSEDNDYRDNIEHLRSQIDDIDARIVQSLAERMNVSRRIGEFKKEKNIAILQISRWDEVMEKMREEAAIYGLDPEFVGKIYSAIHEASVHEQNYVLDSDKK